ncbi:MAG: ribosome small subunit-dependent GTPase A [Eggerthellaceae bacterium]|nr:ribosome small subunit-dependent GTPase A [Eggerthellaceae bacterium]
MKGVIVRLDRGFPLVKCSSGELVRCEHATALVKGERVRAVVGDYVEVRLPEGHDKGVISAILPRRTAFVRRDPAERTASQVLAANFDLVIVAEPIVQLNRTRLERELVLAHETGADVAVVLTKADLMSDSDVDAVRREVGDLAGRMVSVLVVSIEDPASIERVRALVGDGRVAILIGKSGVGKSSLVNLLAGADVQDVGDVREFDGKGRHTTVDRVMVELPGGGCVVDMPGVRGLGMWDADTGLGLAFPDVEELAASCRFRDCSHVDEPGCAVLAAVASGELATARLESYRTLSSEIAAVRARRDEARHMRGEKASDRKKAQRGRR